jgi:hypothetical protein
MATCKGMPNINIGKATHFAALLWKYKIMIRYVFLAPLRNILCNSSICFDQSLFCGK